MTDDEAPVHEVLADRIENIIDVSAQRSIADQPRPYELRQASSRVYPKSVRRKLQRHEV
jgi:hypothetical protein